MNLKAVTNREESVVAIRLILAGCVQGVGLRPAVARWANQLNLTGQIVNTRRGVEVMVEGTTTVVQRFAEELHEHLPQAARVESLERESAKLSDFTEFKIIESTTGGPLSTQVPPDLAVCDTCLADITTAEDIRNEYPMTSCTDCGPRYSIIQAMPYERADTSMDTFPLCSRCLAEYQSPSSRRFHAQTNACPDCGPQLWSCDASGHRVAESSDALEVAAQAIRTGHIVAVRGLGGYQLMVDALSQSAVLRLRQRKGRQGKPLAVMVQSLDEANRLAWLNAAERQALRGPAAPIVIAKSRNDTPLAADISPGLNTIGLMLPTTPLHWLLLHRCQRPLVVTSGNIEGEPLAYQREEALGQLEGIVDVWLEHDRPIVNPIDDSVVRVMADKVVTIRLARGLAPLPLKLKSDVPFLALGGHQKGAFALCNGQQSVLSPHIGGLDSVATCTRLVEQLQSFKHLYGMTPSKLICDEHPDYFTSQWASRQAIAVERVQHHHAHIVAGMLEHDWLDREVLGVAFDGTGYGEDGTIWGGEFLLSSATQFTRVAHLRPFRLPGGEQAIREPWRVAVSLVAQSSRDEIAAQLKLGKEQIKPLLGIINSSRLSPVTSSAGRLFDAVAVLVLGITRCDYEGQAAMLLEAACDLEETGSYKIDLQGSDPVQLDWRPMILQILIDRSQGANAGQMAMRFHRGLAQAVGQLCSNYAPLPVVLGGGVFQNRVLVELLQEEFENKRQPLGLPGIIPPNDGGLAAGQLAVAISQQKLCQRGNSPYY